MAACQLHPLRQWIGGSALPVMGLGTVAIAPTHRRRGLAGRLVAAGLRARPRARRRRLARSTPSASPSTRGLGYGLAGEALQYRLPPAALPDAPERAGVRAGGDRRRAREAVRARLRRLGPRADGPARARPDRAGSRCWEGDRARVALPRRGGRAGGLRRLPLPRGPPAAAGAAWRWRSSAWLTPAARRGLLGWLASLGDQWERRRLPRPPRTRLRRAPRASRASPAATRPLGLWFPSATLLLGPMFRLLDVPRRPGALRPVDARRRPHPAPGGRRRAAPREPRALAPAAGGGRRGGASGGASARRRLARARRRHPLAPLRRRAPALPRRRAAAGSTWTARPACPS